MSIWFEGYGCTANQGETLEMRDHANQLGHELATDSSAAETVVLGTCTVIESTQNKMEKRISLKVNFIINMMIEIKGLNEDILK